MTQVGDDFDLQFAEAPHRRIRRLPVVAIRRDMRAVVRRAVAECVQSELTNEREILFPLRVMTTLLHLIDARARRERGIAVLDAGGKEKRRGRMHLRRNQKCDWTWSS